ncbi:receptor activity-modifying protein 1-like [Lethenteron reissneri]|uniref:receptor activity-modifying protein 1-like n=1 Tax=Lethenteron reissneri TaxID=7753 RepID=UPI002AB6462A|nr:receptor activity-modifying protein 1-like [Lethenteron reissneri]XP_061410659.1 receptor activity-modifying protein 1-like [Lethenteron reissneri]
MGPHVLRVLGLLVLSLALSAACNTTGMIIAMDEFCLPEFEFELRNLSSFERCNWSLIYSHYESLSHCTQKAASWQHCFWPNHEVDSFFVEVHRQQLSGCVTESSSLRDPPEEILALFISVPMVLTTVAAGLVVWCSKRSEGGD